MNHEQAIAQLRTKIPSDYSIQIHSTTLDMRDLKQTEQHSIYVLDLRNNQPFEFIGPTLDGCLDKAMQPLVSGPKVDRNRLEGVKAQQSA
jgi:hypothetical protein